MADNWNLTSVEPLDDTNYFLWSEKIEGILRSKKLWKKIIGVKPPKKPEEGETDYDAKFKKWNEWDDDNYATRTVMINTMCQAQLLRYSSERSADKLWALIKQNMAAETEQLKAKSFSELSNLRMKREENVDVFMNRAEALRNQCVQLGKNIEDENELRMYILRGLRQEFGQNVRVLETQKDVSIGDIRYALKQEELRKERRREEKPSRDQEKVRRVKDKSRNDICYNCGMKGHMSNECYNKLKCFNCQGFYHTSAECKEPKMNMPSRGRGYRGNSRGRSAGRGRGRSEVTLTTSEEAVKIAREESRVSKAVVIEEEITEINKCDKDYTWLLDSGSTSHMTYDEKNI